MYKKVFQRLVIQQIVARPGTVFKSKNLMDTRVSEIRVDEEHRLSRFHCKTHRQVHCSQGFTFTVAWTSDAYHIPVIFSKTLHNLGPQNLKGIDKRPLVICSHHPSMTKHRKRNSHRPRACIYDRWYGLGVCSLAGWWPGTVMALLVFMELKRSCDHGPSFNHSKR